jgi:hypothetical protein
VHDLEATPTRGLWSVDATLAYALAARPDGGAIATVSGVDGSDEIVVVAIDRDGRERWRRALCRTDHTAPIVVDKGGSVTVAACFPTRIVRFAADGSVQHDRTLFGPAKGSVRVDAIAVHGDRTTLVGQLHGELEIGGRTFAAWDAVEGGRRSGSGDVIVLSLDGDEIVALAHGHGRENDQATGVAAASDGALWVVGDARHELDFGAGKSIPADPSERGLGFVARMKPSR